jgi:thiamine-phosphate diphosphorylase
VTRLPRPCVCLVTDRRKLSPDARTALEEIRALEQWLDEAIDLVDLIQIRERDLPAPELCALVTGIAARARGSRTAVVVNDRADVALASVAGGVHVRADGPPVDRLRALGPPDWLIGRSVHSQREAKAGHLADYLVFGTIFPSASKPDEQTQGVERLKALTGAATVPVLAIGGIDPARAAACRAAGAAGVAAIGIFLPDGRAPGAMGISRAVEALRASMAGA